MFNLCDDDVIMFFLTVSTRRLESANGFKLSRKTNKQTNKQKKTKTKHRLACITEAPYEPSEANAVFCTKCEMSAKRKTKGGEK